jgi:DNA polymerase III epsilon subunit-like protein
MSIANISDLNTKVFALDLEFIGTFPNCRVWEIGLVMLEDGKVKDLFEAIVDPFPGSNVIPPAPEGYFSPTRDFLRRNGARPFEQVLRALVRWIRARSSKEMTPLFVAHGAFRSDKPVFEAHASAVGFRIPQNWHWCDSLVFAREQLPGRNKYSMEALCNDFFGAYKQTHRALDDARMLARMIEEKHIVVDGYAYPSYAMPLQAVAGIGPKTEKMLHSAGVVSAVHLKECIMHIARQYPTNFQASALWLTRLIGRDSKDIVHNVVNINCM